MSIADRPEDLGAVHLVTIRLRVEIPIVIGVDFIESGILGLDVVNRSGRADFPDGLDRVDLPPEEVTGIKIRAQHRVGGVAQS